MKVGVVKGARRLTQRKSKVIQWRFFKVSSFKDFGSLSSLLFYLDYSSYFSRLAVLIFQVLI